MLVSPFRPGLLTFSGYKNTNYLFSSHFFFITLRPHQHPRNFNPPPNHNSFIHSWNRHWTQLVVCEIICTFQIEKLWPQVACKMVLSDCLKLNMAFTLYVVNERTILTVRQACSAFQPFWQTGFCNNQLKKTSSRNMNSQINFWMYHVAAVYIILPGFSRYSDCNISCSHLISVFCGYTVLI